MIDFENPTRLLKYYQKCLLYLHGKFELLNYSNSHELFNKNSKLFWKCNHINKFLLSKHEAYH